MVSGSFGSPSKAGSLKNEAENRGFRNASRRELLKGGISKEGGNSGICKTLCRSADNRYYLRTVTIRVYRLRELFELAF